MLTQLFFLFFTFLITFALYPLWISFVYKFQMKEEIRGEGPESHKVKVGTPSMGGFIFLLTISVVTIFFNRTNTQTLFPIFVVCLAGFLGIIDDFYKIYKNTDSLIYSLFRIQRKKTRKIRKHSFFTKVSKIANYVGSTSGRGLSTLQKFIFQFTISGFVTYWTYVKLGWDFLWFPLIGNVHIGILYPIFIFFMFVAVMNFVAFTDGIDGLAGGLSVFAFMAYWIIAAYLGYYSLGIFAATIIGALLPFLYFNVYPARIFMGDVGSHVLGATLAILPIVMHREIAMFVILFVFLLDGVSSPLQQLSVKFTGKRLFLMAPLHHHFEVLNWPEAKVTFRFWLFGMIFAFLGVLVAIL
jgi:phospho-N-acetylmuramoyl-pentapeptide-transferase